MHNKSKIVKCRLPKGYRWSDPNVIKMNSPYCAYYHHRNYYPYGKTCSFYPIGDDLYIKGMFHDCKQKNISVKLSNYKCLTAVEADSVIKETIFAQSMIHTVWNRLGLRQGYMVPILKDLD